MQIGAFDNSLKRDATQTPRNCLRAKMLKSVIVLNVVLKCMHVMNILNIQKKRGTKENQKIQNLTPPQLFCL